MIMATYLNHILTIFVYFFCKNYEYGDMFKPHFNHFCTIYNFIAKTINMATYLNHILTIFVQFIILLQKL